MSERRDNLEAIRTAIREEAVELLERSDLQQTVGQGFVHQHIGTIVAMLSYGDLLVESLLIETLGVAPELGHCVTSELSSTRLRTALYGAAREQASRGDAQDERRMWTDDRLARLRTLLGEFDTHESRRNSLVHSTYHLNFEVLGVTRFKRTAKRKGGLKETIEPIGPRDIMAESAAVATFVARLRAFTSEVSPSSV